MGNINRLLSFLGYEDDKLNDVQFVGGESQPDDSFLPLTLLQAYGRILDYNGCPKSGLSRLHLSAAAYNEFCQWMKNVPMLTIYFEMSDTIRREGKDVKISHEPSIGFLYDGYEWYVRCVSK